MANIAHVELTDTFNQQRERINQIIDTVNPNLPLTPGNGLILESGTLSTKITGDGLSFDASGNIVGNDASANILTQVVVDGGGSSIIPTTITDTYIDFPAFNVIFDQRVWYGKKISDFNTLSVPASHMPVLSGANGAVFVFVNDAGQIQQSLTPPTPENSSINCLLGSYYRLNNKIQSGSWAYTPWNGATSKDTRFNGAGQIAGGLLAAASSNTLSRNAVSVILEGVNIADSIYNPNKKEYAAESPYTTKPIWPTYDASSVDTTTLDTTHIYNTTSNTVDDISGKTGFIVLVPGIVVPTGQDVYLMAQSTKSGSNYPQIFSSMNAARDAIFSLQVTLGNIASRISWLGQSIIVKIGATDYTDTTQLQIVGQVPSVLASYTSLPGAGTGTKIEGLTIKLNGSVIGTAGTKTNLNFNEDFTIENTSESEVKIIPNDQFLDRITNCIIEIPQNIKLELNNGTVTLKKGSIVTAPNGTQQTATTDRTSSAYQSSANGKGVIFCSRSNQYLQGFVSLERVGSGATLPGDGTNYSVFYNSTDNKIYLWQNNSWGEWDVCLPLAIVSVESGVITSIDQIFNAFGYIGIYSFLLPGVKFLLPNGFNDDGTLKSTVVTRNSLYIRELSGSETGGGLYVQTNGSVYTGVDKGSIKSRKDASINGVYYIENENKNIQYYNNVYQEYGALAATYTSAGGIITSFDVKTAFHAVDYNDLQASIKTIEENEAEILASQKAIVRQTFSTSWPSSTTVSNWPHSIIISRSSGYTFSTTLPSYSNEILTWEVVIKNTSNSAITLSWPSVYQAFNNENLPTTLAANTAVFFMMRKYSNNYALVSVQGYQSTSLM